MDFKNSGVHQFDNSPLWPHVLHRLSGRVGEAERHLPRVPRRHQVQAPNQDSRRVHRQIHQPVLL